MMDRILEVGAILAPLVLCSMAASAANLSVTIDNDVEVKGKLHVQLYRSESQFDNDLKDWTALDAYQSQHVELDKDSLLLQFENLTPAWYAIRLYVDENSNDKLDLSRAGIPKEAVGFSNNPMLFSGRPKIAKTSFKLVNDMSREIKLMKDKRK